MKRNERYIKSAMCFTNNYLSDRYSVPICNKYI